MLYPRPGRGGGVMRPSLRFIFCDARRTMSRIVLQFCIVYGASFAQLLVKKKMTGSCQVTELRRHKRHKVRSFLREKADYCALEGDVGYDEGYLDYIRSELTLLHRHHIL